MTAFRPSGNLAQVTWTTDGSTAVTGEGGASAPPALMVAEFTGWRFSNMMSMEDTTTLASDSNRIDVDSPEPRIVECVGLVNTAIAGAGGSAPEGIPRLPYTHTNGVRSTAKLKLFPDKNNAVDYYIGDAHYLGLVYGTVRGTGGRKQTVIHRVVYTGALTQLSDNVSTTIR